MDLAIGTLVDFGRGRSGLTDWKKHGVIIKVNKKSYLIQPDKKEPNTMPLPRVRCNKSIVRKTSPERAAQRWASGCVEWSYNQGPMPQVDQGLAQLGLDANDVVPNGQPLRWGPVLEEPVQEEPVQAEPVHQLYDGAYSRLKAENEILKAENEKLKKENSILKKVVERTELSVSGMVGMLFGSEQQDKIRDMFGVEGRRPTFCYR